MSWKSKKKKKRSIINEKIFTKHPRLMGDVQRHPFNFSIAFISKTPQIKTGREERERESTDRDT